MKQSPLPPATTLTVRSVNGGSGGAGGGGSNNNNNSTVVSGGGVHFVLQRNGQGGNLSAAGSYQNQNGKNGNQIVFRRFPNNNVVQVRRIITQQPQQFQHIVAGGGGEDQSSSESSSVGYEQPAKKRIIHQAQGVARGGGAGRGRGISPPRTTTTILRQLQPDKRKGDGEHNESAVDVDISIWRERREKQGENEGDEDDDDDDEEGDLLIDEDDDVSGGMEIEDDGAGPEDKSAIEINGQGVDSEYLKHVIETQILNRHKTKINDWDGTKGHMCQSCHETFLSESGLEVHRNRKILHILFFCRNCKRDLSFFNKCRLLQHLRNHRVTPTVSGLQNCIMIRLLPESEYLHFKYEDCTSSSDEDDKCGSENGGGGSGSSNPPKRMKPSKFRRIARSSLSNDKDSDLSPPPSTTRTVKVTAPPKENSQVKSNPPKLSPAIASSPRSATPIPTPTNASSAGRSSTPIISENKQQQQQQLQTQSTRTDQVTVIKCTGNTASVIKPSSVVKTPSNPTPNTESVDATPQVPSTITEESNVPQIRIRSLSQLTETGNQNQSSVPQDEGPEMQGDDQYHHSIIKLTSTSNNAGETEISGVPSPSNFWHCYKCDIDFDSAQELFSHLQEAEQQGLTARSLHRCTTDDIPSWSQCQYVFHTKVFHERSVPSMCPGCGHEAVDYNALLEHVANNCSYISQRARYLCASQKCSFTDKISVKSEPEIIDHLKKEHSRSIFQCVHCTQGFATDNWLIKHLDDVHSIVIDDSKTPVEREALISKNTRPLTQCLICNILFPNGPTYLQHVYLNFHVHILLAKMLECQGCFAVFETKEDLTAHRASSDQCRKLDPQQMKISWSSSEMEGPPVNNTTAAKVVSSSAVSRDSQPTQSQAPSSQSQRIMMTPTPIKIIANPAAILTTSEQAAPSGNKVTQLSPPQLQPIQLSAPVQTQAAQQQQPPQLQIQQSSASQPVSGQAIPFSIIRPASNGSPAVLAVISASNSLGPSASATPQVTVTTTQSAAGQQRSQAHELQIQPSQHHTIIVQKHISSSNSSSTAVSSASTFGSTNQAKTSPHLVLPSNNKPPTVVKSPVNTASRNLLKKSFFDNLLSCQFCERLVVFSSLRKHEDQCCGLSSVAPGFCLVCRKNFGDRKTLARHGIAHIQEGLPVCLFCNNRHIRPTHPKSTTPSPHENLYALKKHLYSNHTSKLAKFPFQCPLCDQICKDKRLTEFHIKDHQFKYRLNPNEPEPAPLATPPEEIRKLLRVRKKGGDPKRKAGKLIEVYYCPVCKNREFTMEAGLMRHLKLVHQKNPRTLNLNMFKKTSTARKHHVASSLPQNPPVSALNQPQPQQQIQPQQQQQQQKQKPMLRSVTVTSTTGGEKSLRPRPTMVAVPRPNPEAKSAGGSTAAGGAATAQNRNTTGPTNSSASNSSSFPTRFSTGTVLRKRLTTGTGAAPVGGKKPSITTVSQKPQAPQTRQRSASSTTESTATTAASTSRPAPSRELRPPSNFLQTRSSLTSKVRRKDGTFSCHKCPEFVCKSEDEFCEHVKWKHVWSEAEIQKLQYGNRAGLEEPSEYWCPECNTMFVAKPSLVRHLKFAHDYISSVEEYMLKIGYDGKKPLKPNQCEVCYFQCADDRELQIHMRTHGMAFLRLRQQRQEMERQMANKGNS